MVLLNYLKVSMFVSWVLSVVTGGMRGIDVG